MNCEVGPSKSSLKEDFLSSPFKGDGRGSILFPLRGNFVTLRGCKKITLDFDGKDTTLTLRSTNKSLTFFVKNENFSSAVIVVKVKVVKVDFQTPRNGHYNNIIFNIIFYSEPK